MKRWILLSQRDDRFKKSLNNLKLTNVIVLPNVRKTTLDLIKAFNPLSHIKSTSKESSNFVSPKQIIQTRRNAEFNRAKSIALNIHHTLIVK